MLELNLEIMASEGGLLEILLNHEVPTVMHRINVLMKILKKTS
jgi:hypothetical protein